MILHLIAEEAWTKLAPGQAYTPESLKAEGFIHCTSGDELLLQVANTLYKSQPGEFLVLVIDETKLTAPVKWEAPTSVPPSETVVPSTATLTAAPPEAAAEYGLPTMPAAGAVETAQPPVTFPHIYGPLNREAVVDIRHAVRADDGTFVKIEPLAATPGGMNLKTPTQLANELVDVTGEFSEALARFKDQVESRMDEMDKKIKGSLGE